MKPDWDKLMTAFKDSSTVLIADVDCTAGGKSKCDEVGVRGYPTIKYGDPSDLQDYKGGRDFAALKKFADGLGPTCSPANLDLCDEEKKAKIAEFAALGAEKREEMIKEKEAESAKLEADFKTFVEGLHTRVPFVTVCTAGADKVTTEGSAGVRLSLPKPLDKKQLQVVLDAAGPWWASHSPAAAFDVSNMSVIVASDEPICSMALVAALTVAGVADDNIQQAEGEDELGTILAAQQGAMPTIVMLDNIGWAASAVNAIKALNPKPYLVNTSERASAPNDGFNTSLPKTHDQAELSKVLQAGHEWWASGGC